MVIGRSMILGEVGVCVETSSVLAPSCSVTCSTCTLACVPAAA